MSNDLSDWTERPNPWRDALVNGAIISIGMLPIVGPLAAGAAQATLTHKQTVWITEGFSRTAARLRALEDRPTPEQMLASDEFTAACAAAVQTQLRTASADKRARLADALAHMGPWGPFDEDERASLFDLVTRYSDLHVQLLAFFADPPAWVAQQPSNSFVETFHSGALRQLLTSYGHQYDDEWLSRAGRVVDELGRDGLIDAAGGHLLQTVGSRAALLSKRSTRLGDDLLAMIRVPEDSESPTA